MTTLGEISNSGEFVIEWSIKDFSLLSVKENVCYNSPSFSFANESWYLQICPNGETTKKTNGYIDIYLQRESTAPSITVEFTLGMKTADGELDPQWHITEVFEGITGWGCTRLLSRNLLLAKKSKLLPSDTLTLVCRMKCEKFIESQSLGNKMTTNCSYCNETLDAQEDLSSHLPECEHLPIKCRKCISKIAVKDWCDHKCNTTKIQCEECNSRSFTNSIQSKVIQDYKELFLKQKECDVILRVKEEEFPAHKNVLVARSPVFESTFRNDMKEKQTGIVDIEDCDPSSFSSFLRFLYCGETETISDDNVCSLFITADKYDVQDLREVCMKFIKENISVGTFCDTITLALQYYDRELVTAATDFFIRNARTIVKTVQWQKFAAENPTQSNELIIKLLDATAGPNE